MQQLLSWDSITQNEVIVLKDTCTPTLVRAVTTITKATEQQNNLGVQQVNGKTWEIHRMQYGLPITKKKVLFFFFGF